MSYVWRGIVVAIVLLVASGPWLLRSRPREQAPAVAPTPSAPPVNPLAQARATAFGPGPVQPRIAALRVL